MAASSALTPEQRVVLGRIQALMAFWRISPEELRRGWGARPPAPSRTMPEALGLPKYRHPHSGETWDGQGSQPAWLREALLREGFLVEELRLDEGTSSDPASLATDPKD